MKYEAEIIAKESSRIEDVYNRRATEIDQEIYAPWQPAENLMVSERKRVSASLLHDFGKFPIKGDKCLEIGYGKLGWLADLISWGFNETDLHGIELDAKRAAFAKRALPKADLRIGDATSLPWKDKTFDLVVISTVFSSILNNEVRKIIADETNRVLVSGGVLVWYDLAVNNPKNANVRGINLKQLKQLFPDFNFNTRSVTLAPPIARVIAPKSFVIASILSSIPFLRTHFVGVLKKN